MSYVLGLTGSIGMGKTTTAGFFSDAGVPVWDADAAVHALYARGGAAVGPVGELCPEAVKGGAIEREALKRWIAREPAAMARLEAVVHPLVAAHRAAFLAEHADAPLVVLDIPLLFETGAEGSVDGVVVVTTDAAEQRRRVMERPGASAEMFEAILARQMPDAEKRARADFIIRTDTLEAARKSVNDLVARLRGGDDA